MPDEEELDAMAIKLTGHPFAAQSGPAEKAQIMSLCIQSLNCQNMCHIADKLTELCETVVDVEGDLDTIRTWFEKSKLWEAEVWTRK